MTKKQAYEFFVSQVQIPSHADLTTASYNRYLAAIEVCDERCLPLFFRAVRQDSFFPIGQAFNAALRNFEPRVVLSNLRKALRSKNHSARMWAAHFAFEHPSTSLLDPLKQVLLDDSSTNDTVTFAVSALSRISEALSCTEANQAIELGYQQNPRWNSHREESRRASLAADVIREQFKLHDAREVLGFAGRKLPEGHRLRKLSAHNPAMPDELDALRRERKVIVRLVMDLAREGAKRALPDSFWRHLRKAAIESLDDPVLADAVRKKRQKTRA